jgi:hypothetical protein
VIIKREREREDEQGQEESAETKKIQYNISTLKTASGGGDLNQGIRTSPERKMKKFEPKEIEKKMTIMMKEEAGMR